MFDCPDVHIVNFNNKPIIKKIVIYCLFISEHDLSILSQIYQKRPYHEIELIVFFHI